MRSIQICLIPFLLISSLLAQSSSIWPDAHEYFAVDRPAVVLNLEQIKKRIRVPYSALKEEEMLAVQCRILVSDKGQYVRHIVTRSDHEELCESVSMQVATLRFIPAQKDNLEIASWVNVIFRFATPRVTVWEHSSIWEFIRAGFRKSPLSSETMVGLANLLQDSQWEQTIALTTVLLEDHRQRLMGSDPEQLVRIYTSRAMALLATGMPHEAHIDLNQAMCIATHVHSVQLSHHIRSLRILSGIATDHLDTQVEDLQMIQSGGQKEAFWSLLFPVLLSANFRKTITSEPVSKKTCEIMNHIFTIVWGLNAFDQHEFDTALIYMNQANTIGLPRESQRELSLRIAESLRQTNQQEKALAICQELLEAQPLDSFAHYVKGIILTDIGASKEGGYALQRAILLGLDHSNETKAISILAR